MHSQRGNFLLQALLALTLMFAFVPLLSRGIVDRDVDARMFAATQQIENTVVAAGIFIRENADALPYEQTVVGGAALADLLEPYGVPLGYVARTALGQDISLVITKDVGDVSAYLAVRGGNLTGLQRAELVRRIGFYASASDKDVIVGIPLAESYSDVVRRNDTNPDNSAFLTDLDMGGFVLENTGDIFSRRGEFETAQFTTLSVTGVETDRKTRNAISEISTERAVFQARDGAAALALTRGVLNTDALSARTISKFGDTGNLTVDAASVREFSMTAGRSGFYGPTKWDVRGNVVTSNMNFSVEQLAVGSYINATRGQDVYVTDELETSARSGIDADRVVASNITLRDQTSGAISDGAGDGAVLVDLRPAGTSVLPDVLLDSIDNGKFVIIANPADDAKTVDCKSVISALGGRYNKQSLTQYIICQYVFWQRLEKRIDIKQCLMAGKSDCI